nr:MAG: RNA-dependent RNA polymerase [Yellow silver pine associated narna-like virus]
MRDTSNDAMPTPPLTTDPWDPDRDVLSLKSFTGTSILRYGGFGKHLCKCLPNKRHRSLFTVNYHFTRNNLLGTEDCPSIDVCHNAENIWECALPREITGLDNRVVFKNLPNVRTAMKVLKRGTYWYPQLVSKKKFRETAFMRKLARLLAGYKTPEGPENFQVVKDHRIDGPSLQRFRSLLATIDGLLMQVVLALPGNSEFQNWERLDQLQRGAISNILDDYFRDQNPERITTFEKVKKVRKDIKMHGFNPISNLSKVDVPRELSAMRVACSLVRGKTPLSHYQVMILSQTRASGIPPRIVYDRTLAKTKAILTTPSSKELYELIAGPLARATDHFYSDLLVRLGGAETRDLFFQGVVRNSKISLSDSGEFFTKTDVGGKLEASRRVLTSNPLIKEVNLETGKFTGKELDSSSPIGERLFHWSCGKFVNRREVYSNNSMSCRISLVAELGKYRTITVSTLQHALFLHPFSHMGLKILEALPSSQSGIGAANHSWNFFKRLSHKNPSASFIFDENIQTTVLSTDWSSATDYCDPYIAGAMLNRLCVSLGVPRWYRETMLFALTAPRQVELLDRNGAPVEVFYTKRGVLMGDPVTKVVLHLHHLIGARLAGDLLYDIFKDNATDDSGSDESDDDSE